MKVLVWDSESKILESFLELAQKYVDIDLFEDMQDLIDEVAPDDLVVLELDADRKLVEKAVKRIRKTKVSFHLVFLSNGLSSKELAKHQQSKVGGDVYLRSPVDEKLLTSLLGPMVGEDFSSSYLDKQREILSEHEAKKSFNAEAEQIDQKLNAIFKEALGEASEAASVLEKIAREEDQENCEAPSEFLLEVEDEEAALINGESEPVLPDEDNLTYPDLDLSELNSSNDTENESANKEPTMAADDKKLDLSEDSLEELDLSLDGNSEEEALNETENIGELDLSEDDGEALDLSEDDGEALDLSEDDGEALDLSEDDGALDLSEDDGEALDLSQDEGEALDLSQDEGEALDLSQDDGESLDLSQDDGESLDLSQDDGEALDLSEDDGALDELSFGNEEEDAEQALAPEETSASLDAPQGNDLDFDQLSDEPSDELSDEDLFGSGEDLSADSLPESPSFKESNQPGMSASAAEKLAEIEEMMKEDQVSVPQEEVMESTGEINLGALKAESTEGKTTSPDLATQIDLDEPDYDPTLEEGPALKAENDFENYLEQSNPRPRSRESQHASSGDSKRTLTEQREVLDSHDDEFMRLGETIRHLRQDREDLLDKVSELEQKLENEKNDFTGLKAELDEKRIELSLHNKRRSKQVEELKYQLEISDEKKMILEERNRRLEAENEKLRKKATIDLSKIKGRESELENKLELLKADSDLQIRNRDLKILELKRKIDTLEFDIESIQTKEKKTVDKNYEKEERMERVINTLRRAIGELEEDELPLRNLDKIKKNLDV